MDPVDPDSDPQHWFQEQVIGNGKKQLLMQIVFFFTELESVNSGQAYYKNRDMAEVEDKLSTIVMRTGH